jgi:hypothetical protein
MARSNADASAKAAAVSDQTTADATNEPSAAHLSRAPAEAAPYFWFAPNTSSKTFVSTAVIIFSREFQK